MRTKKKILSLLLAAAMVLTLVPVTALAADGAEAEIGGTEYETLAAAISAANRGDTVRLLSDVYLEETILVTAEQDITLDLNGKAITVSQSDGKSLYAIDNYGTFTLTDTSEGEAGSITARGTQNNGTMYIEGGTINSCDSNGGGAAVWNEGTLEMTGGTLAFTGTKSGNSAGAPLSNQADASAIITGGVLKSPYTSIFNSGTLDVTGMTLDSTTESYWMTVKAFSGSITNLTNVTISAANGGCLENAGGTVTLANCTFTQSPKSDVSGEGHTSSAIAVSNGGVINVESGTYTSAGFGAYVFNSGGTINIEGGAFEAPTVLKADNSTTTNKSIINISDGEFTGNHSIGNKSTLSITGGKFSSDPKDYVPDEGYIITETNGTYTVEELNENNAAAKIGSTYYATLDEAISAAQDNDTVTLLKGVEVSKTIEVSENITIDLNGKTVSASSSMKGTDNKGLSYVFKTTGTVVIQNGTIDSAVCRGISAASGELTLKNVQMYTFKRALMVDNAVATVDKDCVLKINEDGADSPVVVWGTGDYKNNGNYQHATLHFYGEADASAQSLGYAAVQGNGSDKSYTYIYIYDGAVLRSNGHALYAPQAGEVTISGGTLTGDGAVGIKSGKLTISGGTLNGTGAYLEAIETNGSGIEGDGSVINIDSNGAYSGEMEIVISGDAVLTSENGHVIREIGKADEETSVVSLNITGGYFTSASDKAAVLVRAVTADKVSITGGYFTSDPSAYVAADLAAVPSDTDGYKYMVGLAVTDVSLDKDTLDLAVGETAELTATVKPDGAANKAVTWTSSDTDVSTVENGTVTAKAPGTATITVTTVDGEKTATCTVTVREEFLVTFKTEQGTAPAELTVKKDDTVTLPTLTADGYTFAGWKCGKDVYKAGDTVEVTSAMTFVAQWNEIIVENVEVASGDNIADVAPELEGNQDAQKVADALATPDAVKEEGLADEAASVARDTTVIANAVAAGQDKFGADASITIVVETYLDIQVTGVVNNAEGTQKSVTLDITPMYQLKATTDSSNMTELNTVKIGQPQELKVAETVTITLPLPSIFDTSDHLYVKHVSKQGTFYYEPDAVALRNGQVKFENPHGFSEFTLISDARTAKVEFLDKDGNVADTLTLTPAEVNQKLPTAKAPNGKYFDGWKFDGIKGTYTVLTDDLLTELAEQDGTITATPVFSRDDSDSAPTYAVTAPSKVDGGTVKVSPSRAEKGETVTITVTPDEGYELDEIIVTDKDGDELKLTEKSENRFTFRMPASKVSIEVSFVKTEEEPVKPVEPVELPFTDVAEDAWYAEAVQYVYEKGLMGGSDSAETFQPEAPTTRAMLVTILYRLEGEPAVTGASAYTDVPAGQYYTDAVAWATRSLIVEGYNGLFRPNDTLTRQDLAAILYRYASYKGYDMSQRADLTVYTDATQVSPYAADAMAWANAEELITGLPGALLAPQSDSTRAVIATILMRFCENVAK